MEPKFAIKLNRHPGKLAATSATRNRGFQRLLDAGLHRQDGKMTDDLFNEL